ncbi:unnamed protein product [Tetraodon nigroviridis]|uniref:(spotted green pufferfish) hypothetical protein n=1 Tax=Tetraodon nigroviridis TaxID=99883 RepID=Q4SI33_TETNG|nr:unnamed protein product [Tetraodon nigroviridis]
MAAQQLQAEAELVQLVSITRDLSMNNITELPAFVFQNFPYLEELRLAGNDLSFIHPEALSGLHQLKVLMLQNNQLKTVPSRALKNLHSLQSLRLDANHISAVPEDSFEGLQQLRHLWLDDNNLTEVPVGSLRHQANLQALTLALNRISYIPDSAFANLSSLVVLHLHNNRIKEIGDNCFAGLSNLETLDLNFNSLMVFPRAVQALPKLKELGFHSNDISSIPEGAFHNNPLLRTIHLYDNPLSFVGASAFQNLSELHSLMLRGANMMQDFPILTWTSNLESLTLSGTKISSIPAELCEDLKLLRTLDLSYNRITEVPTLQACVRLQEINLQHNRIGLIDRDTFQGLSALRLLDLSRNEIRVIHKDAFLSLSALTNLDLSMNSLTLIPTTGLSSLSQLKLAGNPQMKNVLSAKNLPRLRSISVPYAYQCCAFIGCDLSASASAELQVKKSTGGSDVERISMLMHCSPSPGAFKPCEHLLGNWMIRLTVWFICLVSLVFNSLVLVATFCPAPGGAGRCRPLPAARPVSPWRLLMGLLALANLLTGLYVAVLTVLDAATWGSFAEFGVWWESGPGCQTAGVLALFSSEWSVLLLALAAVERRVPRGAGARRGCLPRRAPLRPGGGAAGAAGRHRRLPASPDLGRAVGLPSLPALRRQRESDSERHRFPGASQHAGVPLHRRRLHAALLPPGQGGAGRPGADGRPPARGLAHIHQLHLLLPGGGVLLRPAPDGVDGGRPGDRQVRHPHFLPAARLLEPGALRLLQSGLQGGLAEAARAQRAEQGGQSPRQLSRRRQRRGVGAHGRGVHGAPGLRLRGVLAALRRSAGVRAVRGGAARQDLLLSLVLQHLQTLAEVSQLPHPPGGRRSVPALGGLLGRQRHAVGSVRVRRRGRLLRVGQLGPGPGLRPGLLLSEQRTSSGTLLIQHTSRLTAPLSTNPPCEFRCCGNV